MIPLWLLIVTVVVTWGLALVVRHVWGAWREQVAEDRAARSKITYAYDEVHRVRRDLTRLERHVMSAAPEVPAPRGGAK